MDVEFNKAKSNNIFLASLSNRLDGNFFVAGVAHTPAEAKNTNSGSTRLNDFDSNILENNAYQDLPDEMLKIEHKIGMLETSLAKINSEIEGLESLGETSQILDLIRRKASIEKELAEQNKKYGEFGMSAKISNQVAHVINFTSGTKSTTFSKVKRFLSHQVLARLSKKIKYSQQMKEALEKLSNINANVDELVSLKTPYGEKLDRYDKLTAYLKKANTIHSLISEDLKSLTNEPPTTVKSRMI